MNKRRLVLLCAAALGLLCAVLGSAAPPDGGGLELLASAGSALRALSLSGMPGNLCAWLLVYLFSSPPVLWMLLHRRKHGGHWADFLMALSSLLILGGLYTLVNPTLLGGAAALLPGTWPLAFWVAALSVTACWVVLLFLDRLEQSSLDVMSTVLSVLLAGTAALWVFSAVCGASASLLNLFRQAQGIADGPSFSLSAPGMADVSAAAGGSALLLAVVVLLDLIPSLMGAAVLLWGGDFVNALQRETFGAETVALCRKTASGCRRVVQLSVGLSVCSNLIQLLAMPQVLSISLSFHLPLITLLLSAALLVLCRCFQRGQELQEDSDSII